MILEFMDLFPAKISLKENTHLNIQVPICLNCFIVLYKYSLFYRANYSAELVELSQIFKVVINVGHRIIFFFSFLIF